MTKRDLLFIFLIIDYVFANIRQDLGAIALLWIVCFIIYLVAKK